nr:MAG TPA: hypothetical protein [Caudoviricetes sp.]
MPPQIHSRKHLSFVAALSLFCDFFVAISKKPQYIVANFIKLSIYCMI